MRKGRLIVLTEGSLPFPHQVFLWPLDKPVPPGYEEVHAVRTMLADLCACGHARGHHVGHRGKCMVLGKEPCSCEGFEDG